MRKVIGILFIIIGVLYFFYPNAKEWQQQRESDRIIRRFEQDYQTPAKDSGRIGMDATRFPELYQQMEDYNLSLQEHGQDIMDAWNDVQNSMDLSILGTNDDAIGYVEIPEIQLKLPLYLGAEHLSKGAAVVSSTSMPIGGKSTNSVIAGHNGYRGSNMFHEIETLTMGSTVYITNPWGKLAYQVTSMKVVHPSDTDAVKIQEGRDMITLVTCYPYRLGGGENRLLVFCDRADDKTAKNLDLKEKKSFKSITGVVHDIKEAIVDETGHYSISHVIVYYNDLGRVERLLRVVCPVFVVLLGLILLIKRK